MASVEVGMTKCPSCKCAVDFHMLNVTSFLGPPVVECHWCRTLVTSDRIEWQQMRAPLKTWFYSVSLLYIVLATLAGGLTTTVALHFLKSGGEFRKDWGLDEPAFWIGGIAWGIAVAFIQFYRVQCSLKRVAEQELKPLHGSLISFQVGGQMKLLVLMLLFPGICWVIGHFSN